MAGRLANQELAKGKLKDINGNPCGPEKFSWWNVVQENGRWQLSRPMPSGVSAFVSFDLDGSNSKVAVSYSAN